MTQGGLFAGPGPRWFTIPAHRPFVEDLARGLLDALGADHPEALAEAVVLLPTRRGARELVNAFLRASADRPLLPPQVRALGDLDEGEPPFEPGDLALDLPPAIGAHQRRFELARLAAEHEAALGRELDVAGALDLADGLGAFLDSAAIEEVDPREGLDGLTDGEHASHWLRSADFLRLAVEAWPKRLAELGLVDPSARRVALLRALAERWTAAPPTGVLVAAGSTGSAPSTADLLRVVAAAPRGCTVLPGLDKNLADEAWVLVGQAEAAQHPQHGLARLLRRAGVRREEVQTWPASPESVRGRARRRLINEALRPAEATADWLRIVADLKAEGEAAGADPVAEGLQGLSMLTARDEDEAAAAIALLLRETLETPGRTAALVTPDQALGRRVSARLLRWGVAADSSAGAPLSTTPVGVLVQLTAGLMDGRADPVAALGLLKHPRVRLGRDSEALWSQRTTLERYGLRGARPRNWGRVRDRLEEEGERRHAAALQHGSSAEEAAAILHRFGLAADLVDDLEEALAEACAVFHDGAAETAVAARAHAVLLETLAADADGRAGALWGGGEGDAAAGLFTALLEESGGMPPVTPGGYAELVERVFAGEIVRAGGGAHPRLRILGAIEARLVRADRLVLAGLEEGVWPAAPPTDPFLSRPMRARLGLPSPERRVGLAAHDFSQAACAPEVFLVHSQRRGGQPAVKSRWLWRLETLAAGAGVALSEAGGTLSLARALDQPAEFRPAKRPRPTPPVSVRPRELFVTRVEAWIRDPYAIYARNILKLDVLSRPDEPVGPRERGSALHLAFQRFAERHPGVLPPEADVEFEQLMGEALVEAGMHDHAMARENALSRKAAGWSVDLERRRRGGCARLLIEQTGTLQLPALDFVLKAKADRLEISDCGHVIDFKTGEPPSKKQVKAGLAPQLTLTAAILAGGGFEEAGQIEPGQLVYVKITGRSPPGREVVVAEPGESADLAAEALAGLRRRIAWFDDPATPYSSRPVPAFASSHGDYDQLARVWEWAVIGGDEEGGEA
ncbi:MAG: double-strand break repair protein AddB [Proteobacteria bacterium]|nr:double-strand break repair protein AddB [Pseudomonadota bacterium]